MTQEERQLLLQDLCTRLPYGVICSAPKGNGHLCSINQTIFGNEYGVNVEATKRDYFNDNECDIKPYLRPMSSMTEEEKVKYCELQDEILCSSGRLMTDCVSDMVDWLNKNMFDYRGLIPMGLASEAQEGMYGKEAEK